MGKVKKSNRSKRQRGRVQYHKRSVLAICGVLVMLVVVLSIGSISLQAKNRRYMAQEDDLYTQREAERAWAEEIKDLEEYVGTDEYIKDVAKEKLRLIEKDEILFKAE